MKEKKPKETPRETPREATAEHPERRNFLVRASALAIGGFVGLFPAAAGLAVFLDPLRRKSQAGNFVKVADVADLPADGVPRPFMVRMDRNDVWNFYPNEPVGAVYLRRASEGEKPQAVSATCPHLGCFVDYESSQSCFRCPCHDSSFEQDGKRILPPPPKVCPAARDLDELEVEVRNGGEVWVKYEKFRSAIPEKIPEA